MQHIKFAGKVRGSCIDKFDCSHYQVIGLGTWQTVNSTGSRVLISARCKAVSYAHGHGHEHQAKAVHTECFKGRIRKNGTRQDSL